MIIYNPHSHWLRGGMLDSELTDFWSNFPDFIECKEVSPRLTGQTAKFSQTTWVY